MLNFDGSMLVDVLTNLILLTLKLMEECMNKIIIMTVWNLGGLKRTHCSLGEPIIYWRHRFHPPEKPLSNERLLYESRVNLDFLFYNIITSTPDKH